MLGVNAKLNLSNERFIVVRDLLLCVETLNLSRRHLADYVEDLYQMRAARAA